MVPVEGRLVARAYHLISVGGSVRRYHVVQPDGLPDVALTLFANEQLKSLSASSVPAYVREIVALLNWARTDPVVLRESWSLTGPPAVVRNLVREYLCVGAKCKVTTRPDIFGLKVTYVRGTDESRINVRILVTALKRLFDLLIEKGIYRFPNPLIHEDAARMGSSIREGYREAVRSLEGREPMPACSGVDPPSGIRLSESYFRCVEREWVPKSIDDPDFPNTVYAAGKAQGWGLRELCIARTLFEAGARISEITELSVLDWAYSQFMNRLRAKNKGSLGVRTKVLVVSQPTAKLYRKYFDDDMEGRRLYDRRGLTLANVGETLDRDPQALAEIPLFITRCGTPMSARVFRECHWKPALYRAGIDADPHIARHWFVTNALRNIESTAKDAAEIGTRKEELIQYMRWRTGERTLKVYEHLRRDLRFAEQLAAIHETMQRRERAFARHSTAAPLAGEFPVGREVTGMSQELAYLLGEDEGD